MHLSRYLLWIVLLIAMVSCQEQEGRAGSNVTTFSSLAMGMPYRITIGKPLSSKGAAEAYAVIASTFEEVDALYNNWNPESEVSKLNKAPAGVPIALSPKLEKLLLLINDFVLVTEGFFDPTVAPLSRLWKESLQNGTLPDQESLNKRGEAVGWHRLHFEGRTVTKDNALTGLDLGGVAKGYCVDLLIENLAEAGFHDTYVEWGGEIRAAGLHPDKRPWTIFISRLEDTDPAHAIDIVTLDHCAIATSGNYLQKWRIGETTYTHIVNPIEKEPLKVSPEKICSATVQAPTCVLADALATAAMLFPTVMEAEQWAAKIQKTHPSINFWFLSNALHLSQVPQEERDTHQ